MNQFTVEVTDRNFQEQVLQSTLPVLVEFTADWCPPCKMLAPIVDAIAQKFQGKLIVGKLDGDANLQALEHYDVMGFPTLILFNNGLPVERIVGFTRRDRIEASLTPYLNLEKA